MAEDDAALGRLLKVARRRHGKTQTEVSRLSGASLSAVRAYESGARRPKLETLERIIEAVGLPRDEANPILASYGYAPDLNALLGGRWQSDLDKMKELMEECAWPAFITGQGFNIVYGNRVFERVWDVELADYRRTGQPNILGGASLEHFARYVENYDELLAFMMGLMKADPRMPQELERPAPWNRDALETFIAGDPQYIKPLLDAWDKAEPVPHDVRMQYEVRWSYRGEVPLRFKGLLTIADIWNELSWNDWIPADAPTWEKLQQLMKGA